MGNIILTDSDGIEFTIPQKDIISIDCYSGETWLKTGKDRIKLQTAFTDVVTAIEMQPAKDRNPDTGKKLIALAKLTSLLDTDTFDYTYTPLIQSFCLYPYRKNAPHRLYFNNKYFGNEYKTFEEIKTYISQEVTSYEKRIAV